MNRRMDIRYLISDIRKQKRGFGNLRARTRRQSSHTPMEANG